MVYIRAVTNMTNLITTKRMYVKKIHKAHNIIPHKEWMAALSVADVMKTKVELSMESIRNSNHPWIESENH